MRRATLPLAAIAVAASIFGLPHLRSISSSLAPAYVADPVHCELEAAPAWLSGDVEADLRDSFGALAPQTLRDDAAVDAFAKLLGLSSGWLKSVDGATKIYPNRFKVEFTLRRPVALAEGRTGLLVVDADGVFIAPAEKAGEYLAGHWLPLVHLARPVAAVAPGKPLREKGLREGLLVAQEIAPFRDSLRAHDLDLGIIDVLPAGASRGVELSDVVIYSHDGLPIEWGRARSSGKLGRLEPTPEVKIRGLLQVVTRSPGLGAIKRIRLQFTPPSVVLEEQNGPEVSIVSRIGRGE